jgi:hypothetical protein
MQSLNVEACCGREFERSSIANGVAPGINQIRRLVAGYGAVQK